ncbi:hypothetical protein GCM10010269_59490 [Streptomyces humidus]|uniref:Tetratricopeptide repeat protein n=1 Tax=Streptomyces humidus TaxID=52259 RepID=A0A918G134_9ACTN|nr:hypothetical protein [Streptomyces humidus]GGS12389.1 hypothetical protein GCM10010269_59490 [Streptomyces humidus]
MASSVGSWQSRVGELYREGVEARAQAQGAEGAERRRLVLRSLDLHSRAAAILRAELDARPDEPRLNEQLASLLYSMGSSQTGADLIDEALSSLHESESRYKRSGLTPPALATRIGDVRARRAVAHSVAGHAASALTDADGAVEAYAGTGLQAAGPPLSLDFARVLSLVAVVQAQHGDPDQALYCAGQALSRYKDASDTLAAEPGAHLGYAVDMAAEVASRIEAAHAEWDHALAVDDFKLSIAEQGWGDLAGALARTGVHLRAAGRPAEAEPLLARAASLDPAAVPAEERVLADGAPVTLGEAVLQAGAAVGEPVDALHRALTSGESASVTGRLPYPEAAPPYARRLGRLAAELRESEGDPDVAWRLALESHLLYSTAFRHLVGDPRNWLREHGEGWAQTGITALHLALSRGSEAAHDDLCRPLAALAGGLEELAEAGYPVAAAEELARMTDDGGMTAG